MTSLKERKQEIKDKINAYYEDGILEKENAYFLLKLLDKCESVDEVLKLSALGMNLKRTGFHFDKRLEKMDNTIKYFKKNHNLSFSTGGGGITHKLIIGDNYPALLNLLISYKNKIKVIYIDPPYGKDDMGEFAKTNYDNAITRDNLLSMLYPRLQLARELLKDDGVIFCSIDDRNQAYVKCLFDEVFGERNFIFCAPRVIKKGGKSTSTIQKNHDYVLAYSKNIECMENFSLDERDESDFNLEDEFVETRGRYKLTQTLDYSSLQYSTNMDFEIEINEKIFYAGGSKEKYLERLSGKHGKTDWVWRWSKSAVEWGIKNGFVVVKGNRIYTKTYLKCEKVNGKNEIKYFENGKGKAYTTLSLLDNENSNDNGKKELDSILAEGNLNAPFKNPKPSKLIKTLIKFSTNLNLESNNMNSAVSHGFKGGSELVSPNDRADNAESYNEEAKQSPFLAQKTSLQEADIVLDFFAGSGTTAHAVMELNREDGGKRQFILVTNNETNELNPNGIATDVTSKRLKRIMSGECYDGSKNFKWLEKNKPYGDNLEVLDIAEIASNNKKIFDEIDEKLYGKEFKDIHQKIEWVCEEFELTCKKLESKGNKK
ncbi:site-specific DNA-methyltransferase [uncultured Campylobacter sp.]|uniref:site-specific DNA-methyltransferase n=1 Tax=uncultured Campylobacter sp. TaxID=218934 RepID=UPI0026203283|nr:site-specific DNA-methyltransferase [uncultured Campylobacter sp.]